MKQPLSAVAAVAASLVAGLLAAGAVAVATHSSPAVVVVEPGTSVEATAAANPGAVLVLAAGRHEPFELRQPVTIEARPGAVVAGPVGVGADGVRLENLEVEGGDTGILVRGARHVELDGVVIREARNHGIEVIEGTAAITDCTISGLRARQAQGIEIRNTNGFGRSTIQGCRIDGGQEGIVSHVARLEIRDNTVTGTTMRAIAVTEMSEGLVEGNVVDGVTGAGIYCGDESHCEIRANQVENVAAVAGGPRSQSGQAIVGWYHSTLRLRGNGLAVAADPAVDVYLGSVTVDRFPLSHWPPGWRGATPGLTVVAWSLGALALARLLVVPAVRWARRSRLATARAVAGQARLGWWALGTVIAIQGFHVFEHVVQVHQTFVAQAEVRSGLVGAAVDTEWLHLAFNAVVLAGIGVVLWLARHALARRRDHALSWLAAAALAQVWHVAEHVVRVIQYLDTGVSPAPGIIGDDLGLVWFHFGINVTVTGGILIGGAMIARPAVTRLAGRAAELVRALDGGPRPAGAA